MYKPAIEWFQSEGIFMHLWRIVSSFTNDSVGMIKSFIKLGRTDI